MKVLVTIAAALLAAAPAPGGFTLHGTVTRVLDGDTLEVRLDSGRRDRVRLIGIDTPERSDCFGPEAVRAARALALGKHVLLRGDSTQDARDRYGRLLAYVWLPGGRDLAFQLIARGFGKTYVFDRPFSRLHAYWIAEARGIRLARSLWDCVRGGLPRTPCDPSYPSVCIPPPSAVGDLDCGDIPFRDFEVVGRDPHGLDTDGDGIGCE